MARPKSPQVQKRRRVLRQVPGNTAGRRREGRKQPEGRACSVLAGAARTTMLCPRSKSTWATKDTAVRSAINFALTKTATRLMPMCSKRWPSRSTKTRLATRRGPSACRRTPASSRRSSRTARKLPTPPALVGRFDLFPRAQSAPAHPASIISFIHRSCRHRW